LQGYNLLISTPANYEKDARAEFWMLCLALGDEHPLTKMTEFSGLVLGKTKYDSKDFIQRVKQFREQNPQWPFLYLLKMEPLDRIVELELDVILEIFHELIKEVPITPDQSFKVELKKRSSSISQHDFIKYIAELLPNPVNLENPDYILKVELLGRYAGLAILTADQVLSLSEGVRIPF
jgi:tRNA acetyltransferase TAN1